MWCVVEEEVVCGGGGCGGRGSILELASEGREKREERESVLDGALGGR